jgi:hypothetical protein
VKRPEHLIEVGLVASALAGTVSAAVLRLAGRSEAPDWPTLAALEHPVWLVVGEVLGAAACVVAAVSLCALGTLYARSSALVAFGEICLALVVPGVLVVVALDFALIPAARNSILEAILFGQRWDWWSGVGWLFFVGGGLLGLLALGIGLARANRALRYPGVALAMSVVLQFVFPLVVGVVVLAVSLIWIAVTLWGGASSPPQRRPIPSSLA